MKVVVLDKGSFDYTMQNKGITDETVESWKKAFFISINDTQGTPEIPHFKADKNNVKVMFFDDVEEDLNHPKYGIIKAFTEQQAADLLDFIEKNKDKQLCMVHCAAGVSRSGAVGHFISDYFEQDYDQFKKTNPYVHPNMKVLQLLNREVRKRNGQSIE